MSRNQRFEYKFFKLSIKKTPKITIIPFHFLIKLFRIYEMVLHEFPAQVTDIIVRIFGRKPFAVRLCNKMQRGMKSLEYFTTHQVIYDEKKLI